MPETAVFAWRGALFILLSISAIRLSAQTETLQQQVVFTGYSRPAITTPLKKIYDEDSKSWYAVYNTNNTVHVYLAITDPQQQRKIIMNGVELWIDVKGKKNKITGVLFPYSNIKPGEKPSMQGPRPASFNNEAHDSINLHQLETVPAQQHEMKLTGFKEELNGVQNINHPSGINVVLYFSKDTLVYEAQLPLNTLPEAVSLNSRVAIGIIEKGMNTPGMNGNDMPPPPDGGGPGDGMMPPPGGPNGEEGMRIFEDNIIWYKFSLQQGTAVF